MRGTLASSSNSHSSGRVSTKAASSWMGPCRRSMSSRRRSLSMTGGATPTAVAGVGAISVKECMNCVNVNGMSLSAPSKQFVENYSS